MSGEFSIRVPVRVDFTGGYTDVEPFIQNEIGRSVNAAISICTTVSVTPRSDGQVLLRSIDLSIEEKFSSPSDLDFRGPLGLIKRALKTELPNCGLDLVAWSDAPTGSGLGTSAAISVAMQLVVLAMNGRTIAPEEVAERAAQCQRDHGLNGGRQDEYASTFGGFNDLRFHGSRVLRRKLAVSPSMLDHLSDSFLLLHAGGAHASGDLVDQVMRALAGNSPDVRPHFLALNALADELAHSLEGGLFDLVPQTIARVAVHQRGLGACVVPEDCERTMSQLRTAGASCKLTGGGGRGACVLAMSSPQQHTGIRSLAEQLGLAVIPFRFTEEGAQIVRDGKRIWP